MSSASVAQTHESHGTSVRRSRLGLWLPIGAGATMIATAVATAQPERADALPPLIAVILVWTASLLVMARRSPDGRLRLSDPGILVLLWAAYYFVMPGISWVQGKQLFLEHLAKLIVSRDAFVQVQSLHILFLITFTLVFCSVVREFGFASISVEDAERKLPRARWLIIAGLIPTLIDIVVRVATTGTITPGLDYMQGWSEQQAAVESARGSGGLDYVLTQISVKTQFYGRMSLGVGLAFVLIRIWKRRRWKALVAFHAAAPILLFVSAGSRSAAAFPFIIALLLADLIAGPIPWRYIATLTLGGFVLFYFYGFYRENQSESLSAAVSATVKEIGEARELDLAEAENSVMLTKEAFALSHAGEVGETGIPRYLASLLLAPVPQQLLADKPQPNSEFLTREMVGDNIADTGFGVAGSIVAEGYFAGGGFGVAVVAGILGLFGGFLVRVLGVPKRGASGVALWRLCLLAAFASQTVMFIRGDGGGLVVYALYYVLVPFVVFWQLSRSNKIPKWQELMPSV